MPKIVYIILGVFVALLAFVFVLDELKGVPFDATGYLLLFIVNSMVSALFGFHITEAGSSAATSVAAQTATTLAAVVASDKATALTTANEKIQQAVSATDESPAIVPGTPMAVDGVINPLPDIHATVRRAVSDFHSSTADAS